MFLIYSSDFLSQNFSISCARKKLFYSVIHSFVYLYSAPVRELLRDTMRYNASH